MAYKKQKKKRARIFIPIILIAALVLGIFGYFAYQKLIYEFYPLKYQSYVEKYSRDNNIDKYLVYAVIKTESGFDPEAVSNVGARGLMQIMEDTFDWIKYKLDDENTVYNDMFTPKKNIEYGCALLGILYDEFGSVAATAAAYHAGRGKVNEWLSDRRYSFDGVHLDEIPTSDTAHYVDKIVSAYEMYQKLYA